MAHPDHRGPNGVGMNGRNLRPTQRLAVRSHTSRVIKSANMGKRYIRIALGLMKTIKILHGSDRRILTSEARLIRSAYRGKISGNCEMFLTLPNHKKPKAIAEGIKNYPALRKRLERTAKEKTDKIYQHANELSQGKNQPANYAEEQQLMDLLRTDAMVAIGEVMEAEAQVYFYRLCSEHPPGMVFKLLKENKFNFFKVARHFHMNLVD